MQNKLKRLIIRQLYINNKFDLFYEIPKNSNLIQNELIKIDISC